MVNTNNQVIYLANPVFRLPRKIIITTVMMISTEAESVTPAVKIHCERNEYTERDVMQTSYRRVRLDEQRVPFQADAAQNLHQE